jgi:glutathione reductase (NADPH)
MSYSNIATVIFSHPPIGCVGLTEASAKQSFGEDKVKVYRSKFTNMFYSLAKDDSHKLQSLFKIICHLEDDGQERVVGVHATGRGIDEIM